MLTDYHAKYFAYDLTRRCPSDSVDKLAAAVAGARVDLNPHQVDAALFAFSSPLSKGAILADEVGLGKTIEAGLVLAQKWAERMRRILIIVPSNLRKQWHQELSEKFFLPCCILETKSYNAAIRLGQFRPFECEEIVICSYQFARNKASDVANTPWDLVVIDEAHRLRNVYKPSNIVANTLKLALANKPKILLTAFWPRQFHRRPHFWRHQELSGPIYQPESGAGFSNPQNTAAAYLSSHSSQAGDILHPLHKTPTDSGRVHTRRKRRSPLQSGFGLSAPRKSSGTPCEPTLPHDSCAEETFSLLYFCHCWRS